MCAVNKPPRPQGVKAWDIDRFDDRDYEVDIYHTEAKNNAAIKAMLEQDYQHDNYIQKQLAELSDKMIMAFYGLKLPPILTSPTYSMLALKDMQEKNNHALNEAQLDATHDPMNAYVESLK